MIVLSLEKLIPAALELTVIEWRADCVLTVTDDAIAVPMKANCL